MSLSELEYNRSYLQYNSEIWQKCNPLSNQSHSYSEGEGSGVVETLPSNGWLSQLQWPLNVIAGLYSVRGVDACMHASVVRCPAKEVALTWPILVQKVLPKSCLKDSQFQYEFNGPNPWKLKKKQQIILSFIHSFAYVERRYSQSKTDQLDLKENHQFRYITAFALPETKCLAIKTVRSKWLLRRRSNNIWLIRYNLMTTVY